MIVTSLVYLVIDGQGNKSYASCDESSNNIQISGMKTYLGRNVDFESYGYHLEGWCKYHGFTYKCVNKSYDFDQLIGI